LGVQKNLLAKAINMLDALGVEYAIITDEGNFGTLEVVTEKQKRKKSSMYPYGAVREYIRPFLQNLKTGEVAIIPKGDFDLDSVGSNAAAYACTNWGKGTHTAHKNVKDQTFELMRLDNTNE